LTINNKSEGDESSCNFVGSVICFIQSEKGKIFEEKFNYSQPTQKEDVHLTFEDLLASY
jgi:hypothetical protein